MSPDRTLTEVSVETLATRMADATTSLQLLDVREPSEIAIASIPGFQAFPLSQAESWVTTLPSQLNHDGETYVLCHHGMRSAQMCQWLVQQGFTNVNNVQGGIDAYSQLIDPSIPRY